MKSTFWKVGGRGELCVKTSQIRGKTYFWIEQLLKQHWWFLKSDLKLLIKLQQDSIFFPLRLVANVFEEVWSTNIDVKPTKQVSVYNLLKKTVKKNPGQSVQFLLFFLQHRGHQRSNSGSNCALSFFASEIVFGGEKYQKVSIRNILLQKDDKLSISLCFFRLFP